VREANLEFLLSLIIRHSPVFLNHLNSKNQKEGRREVMSHIVRDERRDHNTEGSREDSHDGQSSKGSREDLKPRTTKSKVIHRRLSPGAQQKEEQEEQEEGVQYCFMARMAAMKKVLSPISDTIIMARLLMKALKNSGLYGEPACCPSVSLTKSTV